MSTRLPRRGDRLSSLGRRGRRVRTALGVLLAAVVAAAGCSPILARLPRDTSPTGSPTPAAPTQQVPPAKAAMPTAAVPAAVNANVQPLTVLPTPDWPIPHGHFYTQTNGQPPRTSPTGFAVTDRDGIPLWSEFQRLGGPAAVGYPVSTRFAWQGRVTQVFQRAVLQWSAQARRVQPANVLLVLAEAGKGDWLVETHRVPPRLPSGFDQGKGWDQIVRDRLALLSASKPLEDRYRSVPDPLALYGLPDSRIADQGDHQAIRLQRTVLRLWKQDGPWAKAGEVTADNSGDFAVQAGLFPKGALDTEQPPVVPVSLEVEARTPNATLMRLTPTPQVSVWHVGNTGGDGVYLRRTPRLEDKLRAWPDGTPLKSLGEQAQGDGLTWYRVQAPDGTVGWVPARYLKPAR